MVTKYYFFQQNTLQNISKFFEFTSYTWPFDGP